MSDPLAAHAARMMIFDVLCPRPNARGAGAPLVNPEIAADEVAAVFTASWRAEGHRTRRLVLVGPLEVDPAAMSRCGCRHRNAADSVYSADAVCPVHPSVDKPPGVGGDADRGAPVRSESRPTASPW